MPRPPKYRKAKRTPAPVPAAPQPYAPGTQYRVYTHDYQYAGLLTVNRSTPQYVWYYTDYAPLDEIRKPVAEIEKHIETGRLVIRNPANPLDAELDALRIIKK